MNKFTKISAAALFALFLTACDKPAEKAAEPAKAPETSQAATTEVKAEETKTEAAKTEEVKTEEVKAEEAKTEEVKAEAVDPQGVADFKAFTEWKQVQEKVLLEAQANLQQGISAEDKSQAATALAAFTAKVDEVLQSIDNVEIKNAEVNDFRVLAKESLVLSKDLIEQTVNAMAEPNEAKSAEIQQKAEKLIAIGEALQQKEAELNQKYAQ